MADTHWISELYPPRFTLADLGKEKKTQCDSYCFPPKNADYYEQVYNRVVLENDKENEVECFVHNHAKVEELLARLTTDFPMGQENTPIVQVGTKQDDNCASTLPSPVCWKHGDTKYCPWTREELEIFRKVFHGLKTRAVRLYVVASLSNSRIARLERKLNQKAKIIADNQAEIQKLKRDNQMLLAQLEETEKCSYKYCVELSAKDDELDRLKREADICMEEHANKVRKWEEKEREMEVKFQAYKEKMHAAEMAAEKSIYMAQSIQSSRVNLLERENESQKQKLKESQQMIANLCSALRRLQDHFVNCSGHSNGKEKDRKSFISTVEILVDP